MEKPHVAKIMRLQKFRNKLSILMYFMCNIQQPEDAKEISEASNLCSLSTLIADRTTHLSTLPRLKEQMLSSISFNTEKVEKPLTLMPTWITRCPQCPSLLRQYRRAIMVLNVFATTISIEVFPIQW